MGRRQLHLYFGDNGIFIEQLWDLVGGEAGVNIFTNELNSLTSFRQSYTYGQDGWLTIETYGRGENGASEPDSCGKFVVLPEGGAKLICEEPTDAVIIRSTEALPDTYRLEVTVTAIDVGGKNYDPDTFWEDPGLRSGTAPNTLMTGLGISQCCGLTAMKWTSLPRKISTATLNTS